MNAAGGNTPRPGPVIEVHGLARTFRTYKRQPGLKGAIKGLFRRETILTTAVKEISFQVEEGELVGFLGPNGAGKTTTLKMLAGLLHPTAGRAHVLGHVPWKRENEYRRQFSLLLGQKNQLWWDLPARESLELNARIHGIERARFTRVVDELTSLLDVRQKLDTAVRELSLGERMKLELVAALLHEPRVLYLDEPTIGLDVVSQKTVRDFLRHHNATRKTTVLLTSHYMADIQALCRRVIIIDQGTLIFDGRLDEILDRFADFKIITIEWDGGQSASPERIIALGETVESSPGRLKLRVKKDRVIPACKVLLDELPVQDIDIQDVPVEEVVRSLFSRETPA